MKTKDLIRRVKENTLAGIPPDRDTILRLLALDPDSEEGELLGKAAREVASALCRDRAYLWTAIGVDVRSCAMNCGFCSLGERWGIIKEEGERTTEEILRDVRQFAGQGARWIVLRTTQFYSQQRVLELARILRKQAGGDYELGLNIGEFGPEDALRMEDAGLTFIYHTLRLGEGRDTRFRPEERLATLRTVRDSGLELVFLVEPIGPEHTDGEIADAFLTAMEYGASVTGAMARVPVPGTPLGSIPQISEKRLAQVIAVTRLAAGIRAPDICVHPGSALAMEWGANVTVVERGAIPRDSRCSSVEDWNGFTTAAATEWFESAGYRVFPGKERSKE